MGVFVAVYRGINVGGKNGVKMEALRAMHERMGHRGVASYIQSGNVVFTAKGSAEAIIRKLAAEFVREFGFAAKVVVVEGKRWSAIMEGNPYRKLAAEHPKTVHVGICEGEPRARGLKELLSEAGGSERFEIEKGVVYLRAPKGFGTSMFAAGMERACGVGMTVRNWRTVEGIGEMVRAAGGE